MNVFLYRSNISLSRASFTSFSVSPSDILRGFRAPPGEGVDNVETPIDPVDTPGSPVESDIDIVDVVVGDVIEPSQLKYSVDADDSSV